MKTLPNFTKTSATYYGKPGEKSMLPLTPKWSMLTGELVNGL